MVPLTLDISQVHLTDEQFYQLCIDNPEMCLERTAKGILIVMSPVGGESGNREFELGLDLGIWNRQTGLGKVFSPSTIFKLPGGGDRSPDVAWIERSRWDALTAEERAKFPPIAPDFVMELRSRTDTLQTLQEKMQEYLESGVRLGWLFNPQDQQVEIYRPNQTKVIYSLPKTLTGEDILPGFETTIARF
ncbi:Uma2 family endonuclease [Leptothoe spongobia]|uniref:Uma2 family endonuclease n=1 Tax=Leptothoe spongobia TAU-MAC 1115 TaxID=1967444 RepID=A0A947DJQ9_9CYAN|nr:Uma2 family endonuclease [Leptothoe spongobia]MBT9317181.1 Uma2 family endonuclease [Leptothoe spongobia TAU-MAC 1115]